MNSSTVKVLVAESSLERYQSLIELFILDPNIAVAGWAKNSSEAIIMTDSLKPDLVLIDFELAGENGLETTRKITQSQSIPVIIMADQHLNKPINSDEALKAGALALISKPDNINKSIKDEQTFLDLIHTLSQVKPIRLQVRANKSSHQAIKKSSQATDFDVIAIAASTGGPQCLAKIFALLTADFPIPIVVVQHISLEFSDGFINWLNNLTQANVERAKDNEKLKPGHIYIAGSAHHLAFKSNGRIQLIDAPPIGGFRPSATKMFSSLAEHYGQRVLAFILTGMGNDGLDGLKELSKKHATIIAQDESSSIVYGMPKAALDAGVVFKQLSLMQICNFISQLGK